MLDLEEKEVVFIIGKEFDEKLLYNTMRVLENRGCGVAICSETLDPVRNKIYVLPDITYRDLNPDEFDAVVIINSKENLKEKKDLRSLLNEFNNRKKLICATGGSVSLLKDFGFFKNLNEAGKNFIVYEKAEPEFFGNKIAEKLLIPEEQ